jgi:hypothetical protein
MADKNIQLQESGNYLFPKTKSTLVIMNDGSTVEQAVTSVAGLTVYDSAGVQAATNIRKLKASTGLTLSVSGDMITLGSTVTDTNHTHAIANITGLQTALDSKATKAAVTTTVDGLMIAADKVKLNGIATGANNYIHPETHPPSIIAQDASSRFVTDTEKAIWNAKADYHDIYSKAETDTRIQLVIGSAPAALDTLKELADALGNDVNFSTTVTTQLGNKFDKTGQTANRIVITDTSGNVTTTTGIDTTELSYLDGVTSNIQTQLNAKLNATSYTAADVLTKLLTVDGSGSGVDADKFDGLESNQFLRNDTPGSLSQTTATPIVLERTGSGANVNMAFKHTGSTTYLGIDSTGILKVGNTADLGAVGNKIWHAGDTTITATTFSGNASTASKWATPRTITLGGDLTGNVSIDGSANVTLTATVVDDSHAHIIGDVDNLQSTLDSKMNYNDVIMNTNPFGGKKLYINSIHNAIFRASERWIVTANRYRKSDNVLTAGSIDVQGLFDGDYEGGIGIPSGEYLKININFNTRFPGYPYGYVYLSHYYTGYSESAKLRVYCNYAPHGIGWHEVNFTDFYRSGTSNLITRARNDFYDISEMEIIIYAPDATSATITEVDFQLDRPGSNEMPLLDKFRANSLYSTLTFKAADRTSSITLNPLTGKGDFLSIGLNGTDLQTTLNSKASTSVATTSVNGLMAATDKSKLDGIATSANNYTHPTYTYTTPVVDTTTTLSSIPFISTLAQTNGHVTGGTMKKLVAGSNVSITATADGNVTISSTDTNTTYSVFNTTTDGLVPKTTTSNTTDYLRRDGTWATPPDTNTTYSVFTSVANGLTPLSGGGTTKYLRADGTWVVPPDTNTTYPVFNTTTDGLVPKTTTSNTTDYLRRDGTWATPPDTNTIYTHPAYNGDDISLANTGATVLANLTVTTDTQGHVTAASATTRTLTLANLGYTGATNANYFTYAHPNHTGDVTSVADGATTIAANVVTNAKLADMGANTIKGAVAAGDPADLTPAQVRTMLNVADGANNFTYTHPANHPASIITQDASNRFVTDAEKTTWNAKAGTAVATTSANGLMSSTDKTKLDNLAAGSVTSVNTKTGAVILAASDVGALATTGGTLTGKLTVGADIEVTGSKNFIAPNNYGYQGKNSTGTAQYMLWMNPSNQVVLGYNNQSVLIDADLPTVRGGHTLYHGGNLPHTVNNTYWTADDLRYAGNTLNWGEGFKFRQGQISGGTKFDGAYEYGAFMQFGGGTATAQIYMPENNASHSMYYRSNWNGTTYGWKRVLTDYDFANGNSTRGKVANISGDGVMEIGKYIDFHDWDGSDYTVRLTSNGSALDVIGDLHDNGHRLLRTSSSNPYKVFSTAVYCTSGGWLNVNWSFLGAGTAARIYTSPGDNVNVISRMRYPGLASCDVCLQGTASGWIYVLVLAY